MTSHEKTSENADNLKISNKQLRDTKIKSKLNFSKVDRFALWITENVGTIGFFILILVWTVLWICWNLYAPKELRFDPHPAFVLWLFISNLIQLFLTPLIMVGQNLQGRRTEARAEADFEINKKAEQEIEGIIDQLNRQNEILNRISEKIK